MNEDIIYLVLSDHRDCYDCSDVFQCAFKTKSEAEQYLSKYDPSDRKGFNIIEYRLGDDS